MSQYIMLCNWTDQGIRHANDSPDRLDAARDLCQQHGAEMTAFYMTMGIYDLVLVIDAPNDDTMARIAVSLGKGGNVRTITLKTFDESQYREDHRLAGLNQPITRFLAMAAAQVGPDTEVSDVAAEQRPRSRHGDPHHRYRHVHSAGCWRIS